MARLREWMLRLWATFTRKRSDRELEEELKLHMELAAVAGRRVSAGGVTQAMEALREQRGVSWIEDLGRDLRHGMRALGGAPVFAGVAILTLALGIGANTAIFSIVNGVLLQPLAYPRPEQLMHFATNGFRPSFPVAVAEYLEFQQFNRSFADVGAFRIGEVNLSNGDRALRVRSASVDVHLLNALGLKPVQGRLFISQDSVASAAPAPGGGAVSAPVVLISYELWRSAFGAEPIWGRSIEVDGRRLQVVGVMPRGADLMDNRTEIWLPLGFTDNERQARNNHNLILIGRLKDGVTREAAQTELNALIADWGARTGITPAPGAGHAGHVFVPPGNNFGGHFLQMTPLAEHILGRAGRSIWVLQAAVGLVLLIACANVANLLLARTEARRREFALLMALGAGRSRLLRKALTESVMLGVAGGALGVLFALAGIRFLVRTYPTSLPRIGEVSIDLWVMLASFAAAVLCGLLFGLVPAISSWSEKTTEGLKSSRHPGRRALVVAEIGLSVVVIVGAGLLLRTVHNLTSVDSGFNRSSLATFSITLPRDSFGLVRRVRVYQSLLDELRAVPGVTGVSAMTSLPLARQYFSNQTEMTNNTASAPTVAIDYQRVMTDFFEVTGIPILQGRGFQSADIASQGYVALVNETLANTYWKGRNPIGQQLRPAGTTPWFSVIGVVKDVKQTGVDQEVGAEAYVFVDQLVTDSITSALTVSPTTVHVLARTTLPLKTLAPTIEQVVSDIAPGVPVARLREMDEVFAESIQRLRLLAQLLTLFSVLALTLATVGIYGLLSSLVAERRREIGIRLALGARRSTVLSGFLKQGLQLAAIGSAIGLVGALVLNRLLASLLFGVLPNDALTLVIAVPPVIVVAGAACWLPAWRASRLDPIVTLKQN